MNWFEAVEQVGHAFAQDMTYFHDALKLRRTSFGTCLRTFGAPVERNETFYFSRMSKLIYITNTSLDGYVEDYPPEHRDFARVRQKAEKIVFSRTLTGATTRNTRVERDFDLEAIRKLKRESEHDISIGGAELAGLAFEADLVDECQLFLNPVIGGGGKPAFRAALLLNIELLETR